MALVETESLVLKSYDLAEADKIIVFLTREHGIVRGVARGVKRLRSKFGSGLEPLSVIRLTYFQKDASELVSIQQIDLIRSNFDIAADPEFLQKFSYLFELLITFSPPHDPNEKLYRMTCAALEAAAMDKESLAAIQLYFEIWLLRLAGFLPDWTRCERCGRAFDASADTVLSASLSLHCEACSSGKGNQVITSRELGIFRSTRNLSPIEFAAAVTDGLVEVARLSTIFRRVITQAAGREVRGEVSLAMTQKGR